MDSGIEELRRAVEAQPDNIDRRVALTRALIGLGRQLTDHGRDGEATAVLDEAATLLSGPTTRGTDGSIVQTVKDLARLLERTGRSDALRSLLDRAEAIGIGRALIGMPAAALALGEGDPEEARRLLLGDRPDAYPVRYYRLLARIEDALGDAQAAFDAASAMNRAPKNLADWRRRAAQHLDWARGFAAAITPEWASRLPRLASPRKSPAFLVGFPRSGTTLLDTFLMGHSGIAVLEEKPMMAAVQPFVGDIADLPERSPAELEQAREAYFAELDRHLDPGFDGQPLDKLPLNMIALPLIHCLFPDARIIFAQRHPCDVVLSCFMQGFALNDSMAAFLDLNDAAAYYDAVMSIWTRSREVLPVRVHTVVYEELVSEPAATLRPTVEFLGLPWRGELLDHQSTASKRGAISTPSYDQVVQPLTAGAAGRWRRYEKQLEPVLPVLLPWAKRLGYE